MTKLGELAAARYAVKAAEDALERAQDRVRKALDAYWDEKENKND